MHKNNCEQIFLFNIGIWLSSIEANISSVDETLACFNQYLRALFIAWAKAFYKQQYKPAEIEFYADIAFTEALLTFKNKAVHGEIYNGPATVKTVVLQFCKMALKGVLKTVKNEARKKEQFAAHSLAYNIIIPDDSTGKDNLYNLLQKAMEKLSIEDKQIIIWRHIDEKSCDEISRLLAITKESATNRIYRCMERLRNIVQKQS